MKLSSQRQPKSNQSNDLKTKYNEILEKADYITNYIKKIM